MCGEGGEYESAVMDCPLFQHRLVIVEQEVVDLGNEYDPVSYLKFGQIGVEKKSEDDLKLD